MKKFFLLLLTGLACLCGFSQDFSNKGNDFWIVYSGHIDGTTSRMALYVTSDVNATGTLDVNGTTKAFTVTANQVTTLQLTTATTPSNTLAYNAQIEGIGSKKGVHITTDKPVVVYSHILNQARSGSTLVLPTNVLGKEYYTSTYKSIGAGTGKRCEFDVVATEDNSTVEITPTNADASGIHTANVAYQITLQKGDVYQYQSDNDLTGTHIKSVGTGTSGCQKIGVFSGSTWTAMGCASASSGDNLYQEMFPYSSWGKTYYTAPFINRGYDIFRILVQDPTLPVYVNGVALNFSSLISGRFYEISTQGNNTARIITSSSPICVLQYMITQNCDGVNADPEMVILNSVEQTLNDITVMSARNDLTPPLTNITSHYLNIIFQTNNFSTLKIDGNPPASTPVAIGTTGYSYIQENVTNSTNVNPSHHVTMDSGFICIAYGYGNVESYGYNAGTNVKDLFTFITPLNPLNISNENTACAGTPFYFTITYPFQPTSLYWDFHGYQTPNVTVSTPMADTNYFINGKQVWRYKLPTPYIYPSPGNYPVSITAGTSGSDGCGNLQTRDDTLFVYNPPVTDFTWTHSGCATDSVFFKDNTNYVTGTYSYKWHWDFGDGTTDSVRNPKHLYASPNIYTVRFSLISNVGCLSDTSVKQITIAPQPIPKFGISSPDCFGKPVTFYDSSNVGAPGTIAKWYWDYGDGQKDSFNISTNPTHLYASVATYNVTLTLQSGTGCRSNPFLMQITNHPNPVVNFSLPQVCMPVGLAQFYDSSKIADGSQSQFTYLWNFGDPASATLNTSTIKNPTHNYNNTGPFSIKLQVTSKDGCASDTTKTLSTVYARSAAGFAVNAENCLNDTTYFTDQSAAQGNVITNWFWNFGDGQTSVLQNPSHKYSSPGTYSVSLYIITDKGCLSDTLVKQVIVNPLPTASFTASSPTCETKAITFTDASIANAGSITLWHWDFGDGTQQTLNTNAAFTHTYASAGSYTVTLSVETNKGCKSNIFSTQIIVHAQPVVNFILPQVCLSDAFAQFTDSSYIADPANSFTYQWDFGDPTSGALNTSTVQNPKHKYNAVGVYNVTLTVTSSNGCVTSLTKAFTVNGAVPKASFVVLNNPNLCSNITVQIQNTSSVDFGSITKVEIYWDNLNNPAVFDVDAIPTLNKIYNHLYPNFQQPLTKSFQIRFRSFSGGSCVDESIQTITVNATPKVQFNAIPDTCFNINPFQITEASETGGVPGTGVFTGTGITATGIFDPKVAGIGQHTIRYTFTSNKGCVDFADQTINILAPPVANFGYSYPECVTKNITFSDSSVSSTKPITTWIWNFNDGTVVTKNSAAPFIHVFNAAGNYAVTLTVYTAEGCASAVFTKKITINPLPVPDFSLPKICLPNAVAQFNDLSTISDGTNQFTYLWNFGDINSGAVNTSSQKNPTHIYTAVGPYNISLQVTSSNGCTKDTVKIYNDIHPQPIAKFISDSSAVCLGTQIHFTDQSNGLDGTEQSYQWNFGDGTTSSLQNPAHNYSFAGTFNVSLYITNSQGCLSDTFKQSVIIYPFPVVNAGPDRTVLEGGTITLQPTVTGNNLQYLWTPNLYLNNNTILNPVVSGVADITYTLTVTARGGCVSSDQVFVKVLKFPTIPNTFTPNNDGVNDTWVIQNLETYPKAHVEVFNRYGQLVFESVGYTKPWDGTLNGKPLPFGTYYYVIEPGNGRKPITGYVTLLK